MKYACYSTGAQNRETVKGALNYIRSPKFGDIGSVKYSNTNYLFNEVSYLSIEWKIIDFVKNSFPLPNTKLAFVISPVKRLLVM